MGVGGKETRILLGLVYLPVDWGKFGKNLFTFTEEHILPYIHDVALDCFQKNFLCEVE